LIFYDFFKIFPILGNRTTYTTFAISALSPKRNKRKKNPKDPTKCIMQLKELLGVQNKNKNETYLLPYLGIGDVV
jgi:hypothetical protein